MSYGVICDGCARFEDRPQGGSLPMGWSEIRGDSGNSAGHHRHYCSIPCMHRNMVVEKNAVSFKKRPVTFLIAT